MRFRSARHTAALEPVIRFYTDILGLEVLGDFKGHAGYDGVFLGKPGASWHMEFTKSTHPAVHQADEDDLLVFYPETLTAFVQITERFKQYEVPEVQPKNPYWEANGITYTDPDGYRIVIAKPAT